MASYSDIMAAIWRIAQVNHDGTEIIANSSKTKIFCCFDWVQQRNHFFEMIHPSYQTYHENAWKGNERVNFVPLFSNFTAALTNLLPFRPIRFLPISYPIRLADVHQELAVPCGTQLHLESLEQKPWVLGANKTILLENRSGR